MNATSDSPSLSVQRLKFRSSLLAEASYDDVVRILDVLYLDGKGYRFYEVPPAQWETLSASDSPGRYFLNSIREQYRRARLP